MSGGILSYYRPEPTLIIPRPVVIVINFEERSSFIGGSLQIVKYWIIFQKPKLGHPLSQIPRVKNQYKYKSYISLIPPIFIKFWDDHFHLWLSWYGMTQETLSVYLSVSVFLSFYAQIVLVISQLPQIYIYINQMLC